VVPEPGCTAIGGDAYPVADVTHPPAVGSNGLWGETALKGEAALDCEEALEPATGGTPMQPPGDSRYWFCCWPGGGGEGDLERERAICDHSIAVERVDVHPVLGVLGPLLVELKLQIVHLLAQQEPPLLELHPDGRQPLVIHLAHLQLLLPGFVLDLADRLRLSCLRCSLDGLSLLILCYAHELLLLESLALEAGLARFEVLLPQHVMLVRARRRAVIPHRWRRRP